METDTEALLQDILTRCAQEAAACFTNSTGKDLYSRTLEMGLAAKLARTSARLADSLTRLKKQTQNRGSIGQQDGQADGKT